MLTMVKRLIIFYVFLISYAGAVAHGIVPHHHHTSQKEVKQHHHHSQTSHSHSEGNEEDSSSHDHNDSLYFLTHLSNADILNNHAGNDGVVKNKKSEKLIVVQASLPPSIFIPLHLVFRPPSDDIITHSTTYLSFGLRAPPIAIS